MGKFRDWLENQNVPRGSDGSLAQPTFTGQQNVKVATNQAVKTPQNVKKMQDLSKAGIQGNNDKARTITTDMAADFQKKTEDPTTFKGMVASVANQAPGINAKQLFRDPKLSVSRMKKESHIIDTPKMMWSDIQKDNKPKTFLPKKGTTISHQMGQRKKNSIAKMPKMTADVLTKNNVKDYKNPFS